MTPNLRVPSETEFKAAIAAYRRRETRGPVYFDALGQITTGWGNAAEMAEGIGILLRSWHRAFYRFGAYDSARLIDCINVNLKVLTALRQRATESLVHEDESEIRQLFNAFTSGLQGGQNGTQESTVATAKALHLLAPALLPLWDNPIAGAYGQFPMLAYNYIAFCWQMKALALAVVRYLPVPDDCTVLKRLDEFNYALYTKGWVRQSLV